MKISHLFSLFWFHVRPAVAYRISSGGDGPTGISLQLISPRQKWHALLRRDSGIRQSPDRNDRSGRRGFYKVANYSPVIRFGSDLPWRTLSVLLETDRIPIFVSNRQQGVYLLDANYYFLHDQAESENKSGRVFMEDALLMGRFQFAFTIMYHYLFPQLTMGLGLLIVILKGMAIWKKDERYNQGARFWAKIFAINFTMGVVTGIPMEFQFGTNWAKFSTFAGGVIGQTLAMEGVFAFFLESSFLGLFLFGEKKLGQIGHFGAAFFVFLGSWLSGYFIVATNAWMQHPVAYEIAANGSVHLTSYWGLLLNPWAGWQYAHTMIGSVITAAFVMSALGAFYVLTNRDVEYGKDFLRLGVVAGLIASILVAFPTGDEQGKNVARHQPVTLAAMEGLFETKEGAELILIGQPDMDKLKIDNPIHIPRLLSFLTYYRWKAEVKGLDAFPRENWPDNIPLLYYSYHIMVGLGTIFIAIMAVSTFLLWRKKLFSTRWLLWILMLSFPFPYIANTTGWMTAELGRQPWLVYGLMRTADGVSPTVSAGNSLFTLLGFMGMYTVLGLLFLFLVMREVMHGPETTL